jgi:multiple sugar transport system permease protein
MVGSGVTRRINLPQLFIAAAIAILPLVVIFIFLQRWIVQGVERSGISE